MRTLPSFGLERVRELQNDWDADKHGVRDRERLQAMRLVAERKYSANEIAQIVEIHRNTILNGCKSSLREA